MIKLKSIKGFSVIELLIVIAITSIIAVIGTSTFLKYTDNSRLRENAGIYMNDFLSYKQKAIQEHMRYLLYYHISSNTRYVYTLPCAPPGWCPSYQEFKKMSNDGSIIISESSFVNSQWPSATSPYVIFDIRGTMGRGHVTLKHTKRGSEAKITTNATGRATVTYDMK